MCHPGRTHIFDHLKFCQHIIDEKSFSDRKNQKNTKTSKADAPLRKRVESFGGGCRETSENLCSHDVHRVMNSRELLNVNSRNSHDLMKIHEFMRTYI